MYYDTSAYRSFNIQYLHTDVYKENRLKSHKEGVNIRYCHGKLYLAP